MAYSDHYDSARAKDDVQNCLRQAIDEDSPEMKNYHIRRALQYWLIETESS